MLAASRRAQQLGRAHLSRPRRCPTVVSSRVSEVVVVGCGTAGLCSAIAAHKAGTRVTVIETAPLAERGGNSAFAGGGQKIARESGTADIAALHPEMPKEQIERYEVAAYTEQMYFDDIMRVTHGRSDPRL